MGYSLKELMVETGAASELGSVGALRLWEGIVLEIHRTLSSNGRGVSIAHLGRWTFLNNSSREKGSATGLDTADWGQGRLARHWFQRQVFVPDATFLRANGLLAVAPPLSTLLAPATPLNLSTVARSAGLERDAAERGLRALVRCLGAAAATKPVRVDMAKLGVLAVDSRRLRFDFSQEAPKPAGLALSDHAFTRAGYNRDDPKDLGWYNTTMLRAQTAGYDRGAPTGRSVSGSGSVDAGRAATAAGARRENGDSAGQTPFPSVPTSARSYASSYAPFAEKFAPAIDRRVRKSERLHRQARASARLNASKSLSKSSFDPATLGALTQLQTVELNLGARSRQDLVDRANAIVAAKGSTSYALAEALKCQAADRGARHDITLTQPWNRVATMTRKKRGPPGGPRV